MGIEWVHELVGERSLSVGENGERRYRRKFQVRTTSADVGGIEVYYANGLPRHWQSYQADNEYDLGAWVESVEPHQTEDPWMWEVDVNYTSGSITPANSASVNAGAGGSGLSGGTHAGGSGLTGGQHQNQEDDTNPLNRRPEVSWDTVRVDKGYFKDRDGRPFVNSAGQSFATSLIFPKKLLQLTYTRNESVFDAVVANSYQDTINEATFLGFQPKKAKVEDIRSKSVDEKGLFFWRTTYVFLFDYDTWNPYEVLDEGMMQLKNGKLVHCVDPSNGHPVTSPVLLDGQGGQLAVGANPFFGQFKKYREVSFTPLNIR